MNEYPKFSATREETESFRLNRLNQVWGYVLALSEMNESFSVVDKVDGLHDHKGLLTVSWNENPTAEEKEIFTRAWMSALGDGSDQVEHQTA